MIGYVKGPITHKSPTFLYVECGGVGYHVNISLYTYSKIEKEEHAKLLTYLHVKEDAQTLFGFYESEERSLFIHLLSVSGIGPNTARILLSSVTPGDIKQAIATENEMVFKQVKGIGSKTAKQIILDLKNKIDRDEGSVPSDISVPAVSNTLQQEAFSALSGLGFQRNRIAKALSDVYKSDPQIDGLESLIKSALKRLSS